MNYAGIARFVTAEAPGGVDTLLADLGLSSMQIDDPARGFTFKADGPLDTQMNPLHGQSAASLLSKSDVPALGLLLTNNGDEPQANMLATAQLSTCLKPRGRIAILSFHSGEDRRVKTVFKDGLANGLYWSIVADAIRPSAEGRRTNSRSSAAKLRCAVRSND